MSVQSIIQAFLELAALSVYDTERDRHWKSMQTYCTICNIEYDFILKQESAMAENEFLLSTMGLTEKHPLLHVPGIYAANNGTFSKDQWKHAQTVSDVKTITIDEIATPYKNISRKLIENIYSAYFPFV